MRSATGTYPPTPSTTHASTFGYFPDGTLANVTLGPSAQVQQYCQNNRLQVVGVRLGPAGGGTTGNCASSGDLLNLTMTYGSAGANDGNLTGESIATPLNISQTFTYDAYNRVAKATEGTAPAWSQTYNYDPYGNRWVTSPVGFLLYPFTPTASANYNSNNQLAPAFHSSAYDLAGNQTGIGGYTFTYDAEGRQYSSAVNSTTTYTYDGEGRRVMKATTGGTTTVYVYDATGQVAAEYSTAAPPQVGTLYLTPDHLGSTRLETNDLGAAVAYHDYLPFGEEIPSGLGGRGSLYGAVDGQTHKFTGKERDALETGGSAMQGLDYLTVRYMSSAQGRFTSPDPKHFPHDIADPQSWNKYGYARNNPLRYTDPDGADWQDALKGAINAFTSDNTVGVGRSNVGNGDFRTGQAVGDAVAGVTGTLEALVGSGGEAVGAVLDATGVGALIGVPVNVVSAGIIAHGATTAVEGAGNLANAALSSALGPKEGVSGGPGGGKRVNDQTKRAALEENNAANNGRAKCVFCGDPVGEGAANKINYDHANPKSQNGSGTDVRNVNVTCEYCNKSKGTGSEPKNPKYPDQQ